jgi:hypothetical protein
MEAAAGSLNVIGDINNLMKPSEFFGKKLHQKKSNVKEN